MLGRRRHFVERAVHAVADAEFRFKRLEMDVARAVLNGLLQDEVDELHDGRLVGQVFQPLDVLGGFVHFARDVRVRAQFLENFGKIAAGFALAVKPVNRLPDFGGVGHDDLHVAFDGEMDFVRVLRIERVGQRHLHGAVVQRDGQALIHLRHLGRDGLQQFRREFAVLQRHHVRANVPGDHVQDVVELHDAEVLQQLDHGRVAALDLGDHLLVLEVVNQALLPDERQQRI